MRNRTCPGWTPLAVIAVVSVASAPALAQRQVAVNVDSVPQGATVRVDSETAAPLGTTPVRRTRLRAGAHTLYFTHDGFLPGRLDVSVGRRGETFTVTLQQGGSIYVSADVDGAQIFLDGNAVGTTPGRINNVAPGQHVVELRQTGMDPHRETVTVGAGAVASVNASLRPPAPVAPPTGTVRVIVTNPNGALPGDLAVTFDGTPLQGAPPSTDAAQPGTHILQVSASGFRTVRREVAVIAGQTYALAIDLDPVVVAPTGGTVRVITQTPGAQVFLDGELLAGTPPARDNVPAGTHALRIAAPGRTEVIREIQVTAGNVDVEQVPDLAVATQAGRINVHSSTPGAQIFIDGRAMGPSPYQRDDMPGGNYQIVVRANGFDDGTAQCSVSTTQACDVDVPLTHAMGHGALHVELARPIPNAIVLIDGQPAGTVGAGIDIPNITSQTHEVRVHADGFDDFVQTLTLGPNQTIPIMAQLHRLHHGLSGTELAQRRSAISTWGASPLARGDVALDVVLSYGSYPAELRFLTGLTSYGPFGFDVGANFRTMGFYNELEGRVRGGLRLADGVFAIGGDLRGFVGLGTGGAANYGLTGLAVLSIHSLIATPSDDADDDASQRERSNRAGSIAFSIHFGFEAMNDGLDGLLWRTGGTGDSPRFTACNEQPPMLTPGMMAQPLPVPSSTLSSLGASMGCPNIVTQNTGAMSTDISFKHGNELLVRAIGGAAFEFGVSRNINLFAAVDRVIGDANEYLSTNTAGMTTNASLPSARAIYQGMWFGTDSFTYVHIGFTYKF